MDITFIIACLSIIIFVFVAWIVNGLRRISSISSGVPIEKRSKSAILVVDLQSAFWDSGLYNQHDRTSVEARIIEELQIAKKSDVYIVALRHEWTSPVTKVIARLFGHGLAIAGTPGTEVIASIGKFTDYEVVKGVQDAFDADELDELLKKLNVGHLRIVGLDTNYCVAKTATAARNRGYTVEIDTQQVLAADRVKEAKTIELLMRNGVSIT